MSDSREKLKELLSEVKQLNQDFLENSKHLEKNKRKFLFLLKRNVKSLKDTITHLVKD